MARSIGFQGTYKVSAKAQSDVVVGNWYFGFDCLGCGKRFRQCSTIQPRARSQLLLLEVAISVLPVLIAQRIASMALIRSALPGNLSAVTW